MYIFLIIGLLICLIPLIFGIILSVKKNKFTTIPAYVLNTPQGLPCGTTAYCYLTINYTFNGQNYTTPYSHRMSRAISANDRIEIQVDNDGTPRNSEMLEYPKRHKGLTLIAMSVLMSFLVLFCYAKIVIK